MEVPSAVLSSKSPLVISVGCLWYCSVATPPSTPPLEPEPKNSILFPLILVYCGYNATVIEPL